MPNIWKRLAGKKVESYQFPDAAEFRLEPAPPPQEPEEAPQELSEVPVPPEELPDVTVEPEETAPPPEQPVNYAALHSEAVLRDAQEQAEAILAQARAEAEQLREEARSQGYDQGYAQGRAQAEEEARQQRAAMEAEQEQQLQALTDQVADFLGQASDTMDRQLDRLVPELRDLAMAVAEKVIGISLNASSQVIERMICMAVDKRKRREWAQIYVSEKDAKRLVPLSPTLTAALGEISDRVRIVPMGDDESGACILELPDEIIDASVSTQLRNIRGNLADIPPDPHL